MKNVLYDGLIGLLFFGGLSYISDTFKDKTYYFKLIAFLWAAPFTYFYLLYITSRSGKKSLNGFNTHALIGTLATAALIINYMLLKDIFDINQLILITFILTVLFTSGYYYFRIFEKI